MIQSLRQLDETLLLWFNGFHTSFLDNLALSVSSRWLWLPLYVTLFALIARKVGWNRTLVYVTLLFLLTVGLTDYTCASILRPIFSALARRSPTVRFSISSTPCKIIAADIMVSPPATRPTLSRRPRSQPCILGFGDSLQLCLSGPCCSASVVCISASIDPGDILLGATVGVAIGFTTYAAARPLLRPRPNYTKVAFLAARRYRDLALLFHYPSLLIAAKSWLCALHKVSNRKRRLRPLALLSYYFEDNRQRRHPSFRFSF